MGYISKLQNKSTQGLNLFKVFGIFMMHSKDLYRAAGQNFWSTHEVTACETRIREYKRGLSASSFKPSEPDDTITTSSYWVTLRVSPVESWTLIGQSPVRSRPRLCSSTARASPSSLHRSHFTTAAPVSLRLSLSARSTNPVSFLYSIQEFETLAQKKNGTFTYVDFISLASRR